MRLVKTITIISFFIAASAPLFLSAFFLGGRMLIRHTMMENLEIRYLTTLQIPEESFRWYKQDREIQIDGKMFDVKSLELKNGLYHVSGLYDDEETELNEEMNKFHESSDDQPSGSNIIFQVCLGIVSEDKSFYHFQFIPPDEIIMQNSLHQINLKPQQYLATYSPPPEA
jgi:hypothetical protein